MTLATRSAHSANTVPIIGTIIALLLVWRVLVVGAPELTGDDSSGAPDLLPATQEAVAPDVKWRLEIARDPTRIPPYLYLAEFLEKQGKPAEAGAAIAQAMRLDPLHPVTLQDAAEFHLRAGNSREALPILRRGAELYESLREIAWRLFTQELEAGREREFFLRTARDNPEWWPAFFQHLCASAKDTGNLAELLAERADAGVTDRERRCLLERMQSEGRWAEARELWRNTLPAGQRRVTDNVFNGDFQWPLASVGFDWIVLRQEGALAEIQPIDGAPGKRALRVTYANARYGGAPLYQYLMLSPGQYRLTGTQRADGFESWLGLQWALYCVVKGTERAQQLAKTEPLAGSRDWTAFEREFSVPSHCEVQVLRLELANPRRDADTPGEAVVRLRGKLWYDDIKITALD